MGQEIVFQWGDDLNDLVTKRVRVAVARLIGTLYNDCGDGDILGMVLNRADFPIKEEMEMLLRDIENQSLLRVRNITEAETQDG